MSGCREYSERMVVFYFPEDKVCCKYCPLLQTYSRNQCMRTGELLPDINGTGMFCPLEEITLYREEDNNGVPSITGGRD